MTNSFSAFRLAGLAFAGLVCFAGHAFAAESARTIVFFGDSLTAGYGLSDPASEAYPALVQEKIAAAHPDRDRRFQQVPA